MGETRKQGEVREMAREYGPAALTVLAEIMKSAGSETARIAAAREILDRAYGKTAVLPAELDDDDGETIIRYVNDWRGKPESN